MGGGGGHVQVAVEHRHQMEEEVKRISSTYNEEKQKHELTMKMQQARQRQALQRKLLERKPLAAFASGQQESAVFGDMTPSKQPAFSGLGEYAQGSPFDGGGGGGAGGGSAIKQMQSRGLSLQHLGRK